MLGIEEEDILNNDLCENPELLYEQKMSETQRQLLQMQEEQLFLSKENEEGRINIIDEYEATLA